MNVTAAQLTEQLAAILRAWGSREADIGPTARVLVSADLRGIESHGTTMMSLYDEHRRSGKVKMDRDITVVRESPVTALVDGGGGMGHAPGVRAMDLAIAKCKAHGLAAVGVRNSNHYGAAGVYAMMAAEQGLVGLSTTSTHTPSVVPTFARVSMFGTHPIAFAAPAKRNRAFVLDMASSTVAVGKLKIAAMQRKPVPAGWALDPAGEPVTDPVKGLEYRRMTPLGGTRVQGSHKGYGLAAMVEILSSLIPGAATPALHGAAAPVNVGHFFMAIDPKAFRGEGEFEEQLDELIDTLHAAPRADPAQPVLVAGDPEAACEEQRKKTGIPLYSDQVELLQRLARECGAPFLLAN